MDILESLRTSAARKSEFDRDKELMIRAANEIKRYRLADKFTETELPKGKMMLVGRAANGNEIACMINPNATNIVAIIKVLRDQLAE
jgi:hypothetical protein